MSELRTNKIVPRDGLPSGTSGDLKGGGILQIVTKFKKDAGTLASSYTQNQEYPISGLSLTIKPSSSSSLIWIQGFVHHNVDSGQQVSFYVSRNGTNVSPIGDAVQRFPAIVACERICEEPNLLIISAKGGKNFSK